MKRTPLRAGKPLARRTRLARSAKRITTRTVSQRFAKRRDPAYQAFVRGYPCALAGRQAVDGRWHQCRGAVEFSHVKSRGAGGDDVGNGVPLCSGGHRWDAKAWHVMGPASFQRFWRIDLEEIAAGLATMWREQEGA